MAKIIFPSTKAESNTLSRRVNKGELNRIRQGVYTDAPLADIPDLVINKWHELAAHLCPDAVASYRSAVELTPNEGRIYLVGDVPSRRYIHVGPWLTFDLSPGNISLGTEPFLPHIMRSSLPRRLLENLSESRSHGSGRKTLGQPWVEEELCKVLQRYGEPEINKIRDEARSMSKELDLEAEFTQLNQVIGAILSSQSVEGTLTTDLAIAVAKREPFDANRIGRFQALADYLAKTDFRPAGFEFNSAAWRNLSFFESYFSNFIEGTEFLIDEAEDIVFSGKIIENRTADSHDIMAVYRLVQDHQEMLTVPEDPDHFLELLQSRHALMMEQRPEKNPGILKTRQNKAGNTVFVLPEDLAGTLTRGFEIYQALPAGMARAISMQFLISECHPFDDGNGRLSRVFLNSELVSCDMCKIIVPTVARENYLNALRQSTREGYFRTLVRAFCQLQQYTASIPWMDYGEARETLESDKADQLPDAGLGIFNRKLRNFKIQLPN